MNDDERFDEGRSAAWRRAVVETARRDQTRAGGRNRVGMVVGLVVAALVVSGGGVAYALNSNLLESAPLATASPTPIQRETPSVTSAPTPPPTSVPTADVGRQNAIEACTALQEMFTVSGTSEAETKSTAARLGAQVVEAAERAQAADVQWSGTSQTLIAAQGALIAYLDNNTPEGVHLLESTAAQAGTTCSELGVTVKLEE